MVGDSLPLIHNYSPEKPLIAIGDRLITQSQFLAASINLAKRIPKNIYAINMCGKRSHFMLVFSAMLINQQISLLPQNRAQGVIEKLVRDYDAFIVTDSTEVSETHKNVFSLADLDVFSVGENAELTVPKITESQKVVMAFTSGSTGIPKAYIKPWGLLLNTAKRLSDRLVGRDDVTVVATVPSQHMYGLEMTVMLALCGEVVLEDEMPFYPAEINRLMEKNTGKSLLITTPTHLKSLTTQDNLGCLAAGIVSATAPLSNQLADKIESTFCCALHEIYGCTEAGSIATRRTSQTKSWNTLEDMVLSSRGDKCYVVAKFLPEEVELSDVITLHSSTQFELAGRASDMLNVGGKRYSLVQLNFELNQIEEVIDAVAFVPNSSVNQRPAAIIVSKLSENEISRMLSKHVDPVFIPRPMIYVSSIPRTETGKVTRAEIDMIYTHFLNEKRKRS